MSDETTPGRRAPAVAAPAPAPAPAPGAAVVLMVLTSGIAVVGAQAFLLAPILPDLTASLGATPSEVGRAVGAYGLAVATAALASAGRLERWQRRTTLSAGMAAVATGLAGTAAATGWAQLAAAQLVAGVGAGVVLPMTYALATETAAPGREARTTGRVLLGWSLALALGVPLAAVLSDVAGWRGAVAALAALAAGQVLLYRVMLRRTARRAPGRQLARLRLTSALAHPGVSRSLAGVLAFMAAFYAVYTYAGDHARQALDGDATLAGLVALGYGVGFAAGSLADGPLDRVGADRALGPALLLLAGVYLSLGPAATVSVLLLVAGAIVWGAVNHATLTLLMTRLATAAGPHTGTAMGLYSATTYAAAAVAAPLAGVLYERQGFAWVVVGAAACLAATGLLLSRRPGPAAAALRADPVAGPGRMSLPAQSRRADECRPAVEQEGRGTDGEQGERGARGQDRGRWRDPWPWPWGRGSPWRP